MISNSLSVDRRQLDANLALISRQPNVDPLLGFHPMQRLKTRAQFQAVLAGSTVSRTPHFALHCVPLGGVVLPQAKSLPVVAQSKLLFPVSDVWMGAMVPKRWAKRAVTRNAIKRQIYTVSADVASSLKPVAHVVRLRSGFDKASFSSATSDVLKAAVCTELKQLFAKIAVGTDGAAV